MINLFKRYAVVKKTETKENIWFVIDKVSLLKRPWEFIDYEYFSHHWNEVDALETIPVAKYNQERKELLDRSRY